MAEFFKHYQPPRNAWLGVTVEDKKHGLPRLDHLRQIPAAIRFVSVEPMLEDLGKMNLKGIQWVIVGGESGPKARPMREEWALNVKHQCEAQNVAFFFKQWGGWGADGK
jgi:protein gp37